MDGVSSGHFCHNFAAMQLEFYESKQWWWQQNELVSQEGLNVRAESVWGELLGNYHADKQKTPDIWSDVSSQVHVSGWMLVHKAGWKKAREEKEDKMQLTV